MNTVSFIQSELIRSHAVTFSLVLLLSLLPYRAAAEDYLSESEIGGITAGALGIAAVGEYARHFDSARTALIKGPLPLETSIQNWLGGAYSPGKTNFIDRKFGGLITPVVCGLVLTTVDLSWPQGRKGKFTLQDLFLFSTGSLTNTGINNIAKGLVARPRPYVTLYPDEPPQRHRRDYAFNHSSFYSGHTSSAFFSATYLNKRIRAVMRSEMSIYRYRDWRWAPPLILYGWSTFVAWSRVSAYRHYASDVAIGALAGYLVAGLFFSFNDDKSGSLGAEQNSPVMFRVTVPLWN